MKSLANTIASLPDQRDILKLSNLVASAADELDILYQVMSGPYPRRCTAMLKHVGTIEHQGIVGKCVGATFATIGELFSSRAGRPLELSPDFIYDGARTYENRRNQPGTQLRDGARTMGGWGIPTHDLYPSVYGSEVTRDPTWECMYDARTRKIGRYEFIKERGSQWVGVQEVSDAIRSSLMERCPVAIAMPVTRSIYGLVGPLEQQVYHVPSEKLPGNDIVGSHGMAMFAYDEYGPILEGSWDSTYGDNGLIRLPWRALENVLDLIVVRSFAGLNSDFHTRFFIDRATSKAQINALMANPQQAIDFAVANDLATDDIECVMELPDGWIRDYAANDLVGRTLDWRGWLA